MRVDAHQHFWRPARGDYGWLTPVDHPQICRDVLPADLAPILAKYEIDRTVVVQAAPCVAETEFLLGLARETPSIAAVVGWVDLEAPDAPSVIAALAVDRKLVGLRPMLQDLADDAWMLRPALAPAIRAMMTHHLRFDALVKPRHLPHLAAFLERWPDLPVAIDHGAKPDIAAGALEPWARDMRAIARNSRACCKLSGLITEAAAGWTASDLKPYVDVLLDAFGPDQLMWGSDWPVAEEGGGYDAWIEASTELTAGLSARDKERLFGGVAARFYGFES